MQRIALLLLTATFIPSLSLAAAAPPLPAPSSRVDSSGRIGYAFDDTFSIRLGERFAGAAGGACTAEQKGTIRYNTTIKSIEFCSNNTWRNVNPPNIEIDYTTCEYGGSPTITNYGSPGIGNSDATCNARDSVIVATDSQAEKLKDDTSENRAKAHTKILCCKLKLNTASQ